MTLPLPIQSYFNADRNGDPAALLDTFLPDAAVKDEGQTHIGKDSIGTWWRAAKARYQHVIEPLGAENESGATRVRAQVAGNFSGSPAMLTFSFRLSGGQIKELEIAP